MPQDSPKTMGMPPMTPDDALADIQLNEITRSPSMGDGLRQTSMILDQIRADRAKIVDMLRNPPDAQLLPVPEDQHINPLMAIGATLRAVGGDTKSLDGLLAEKALIREEQRQVAKQNVMLQNEIALRQHDNLIQAMEFDLRGKEFDYDITKAMLEDMPQGMSTPEDAMEWINMARINGLYGSAADMLTTPAGRKAASLAYGTDDVAELKRRLASGPFATDPEPERTLSPNIAQAVMAPFRNLMDGTQYMTERQYNDPDDPTQGYQDVEVVRPMTDDVYNELRKEAELYLKTIPEAYRAEFRGMLDYAEQKRRRLLNPESGPDPSETVETVRRQGEAIEDVERVVDSWLGGDFAGAFGVDFSDPRTIIRAGIQAIDDAAFNLMYPDEIEYNPFTGVSQQQVDEINARVRQLRR